MSNGNSVSIATMFVLCEHPSQPIFSSLRHRIFVFMAQFINTCGYWWFAICLKVCFDQTYIISQNGRTPLSCLADVRRRICLDSSHFVWFCRAQNKSLPFMDMTVITLVLIGLHKIRERCCICSKCELVWYLLKICSNIPNTFTKQCETRPGKKRGNDARPDKKGSLGFEKCCMIERNNGKNQNGKTFSILDIKGRPPQSQPSKMPLLGKAKEM